MFFGDYVYILQLVRKEWRPIPNLNWDNALYLRLFNLKKPNKKIGFELVCFKLSNRNLFLQGLDHCLYQRKGGLGAILVTKKKIMSFVGKSRCYSLFQ